MTAGRHRVFMSYSRSDFHFAEQLATALSRRGLDIWLDAHQLAMGSDWSSAIDRAITECDTFVLVATPEAETSAYVRAERDRAAALRRPAVAVLARRSVPAAAAEMPVYDMRSRFRRGADRLAADLAEGRPTGHRPRSALPYPWPVGLAALAMALNLVLALLLGVLLVLQASQHGTDAVSGGTVVVATALGLFAYSGVVYAGLLWRFLRRRVTWLYLRGGLFAIPLAAITTWALTDELAGRLG